MENTKTNTNLAGYPHYSADEDITANANNVDADMEQISAEGGNLKSIKTGEVTEEEEENLAPGANDVTEDDLKTLGAVDQDMDGGEDETLLPLIKMNEQIMGGDLDLPGNDYNDEDPNPGDEENNLYSKGQD